MTLNTHFFKTLSVRILIFISFSMLLVSITLLYSELRQQRKTLQHHHLDNLVSTSAYLQSAINQLFSIGETAFVEELLAEIQVDRATPHIYIVDPEGYIVFPSRRNTREPVTNSIATFDSTVALQSVATDIASHQQRGDIFLSYIPLRGPENGQASDNPLVLLITSDAHIHLTDLLNSQWRSLSLLLAVMAILTTALWLFLRSLITRPVSALIDHVRLFGEGQFIEKIPVNNRTELGELARTIEQMARDRRDWQQQISILSSAIEQSSDSVVITDIKRRITYVNQTFIDLTGYQRQEVLGRTWDFIGSPNNSEADLQNIIATLSQGQVWRGQFLSVTKAGKAFNEYATISPLVDEQGNIAHYVAVKQNITERLRFQERIYRLAYFDDLTGLTNKTHLLERLQRYLNQPTGLITESPTNHFGALLVVDTDRFKAINAACGTDFGNLLLIELSRRLRDLAIDSELLARVGADSFALIAEPVFPSAAAARTTINQLADRVQDRLQTPFVIQQREIYVTMSIGITVFRHDDGPAEKILRQAEMALEYSRKAGGNQRHFFDEQLSQQAEEDFELERELKSALKNDELTLYLQPKVDIHGQLRGAEALIRWLHPHRGMMSPGRFIPLAEESDLIVDIGKWTLKEALRLVRDYSEPGAPLCLSINISARQFRQPDFVPSVSALLAETGADARQVTLEITESLVLSGFDDVIAKMYQLKQLGFSLSIDDFGTGYSSLSYLKNLPVDEIKIDKTFIDDIAHKPADAALVEAVIIIARSRHMTIVAEGVETREQVDYLQRYPEILLQGYAFDRPSPVAEFAQRWLQP